MRQDFAEYVTAHIRDYLPQDYREAKITLEKVTKGNDRTLTGLTILKDGEHITPTIYLEPYAMQNENGRPMDDILREIAAVKMENSRSMPFDIEKLKDYETVKPLLSIRLCDPERNREYLKDKPYTMCGDLAAAYRIQVMKNDEGIASAVITNHMLELWKITPEELYRDAVTAENERSPVCLYTMNDVMEQMMLSTEPDNLFNRSEPLETDPAPMYVLTNQSKTDGAGVIARDGVLDKIGELIGSDFYILPSSIHELLIIPDDGQTQVKELENMVQEVNATQVAPEDLLSDKVQHYDRTAKSLSRKQEKGLLGRLAENKAQIKAQAEKTPTVKTAAKQEPSL